LQSSNNEVVATQWGASTDIPVVGDFDGDGKSDLAVYRPSTGYWYIIQSLNGQTIAKQWGQSGDIPVSRDYDGDGLAEIAVWRPSTGYWYVIDSSTGEISTQQWGHPRIYRSINPRSSIDRGGAFRRQRTARDHEICDLCACNQEQVAGKRNEEHQ
jgi:hypothetical protein